jgi:hypothetical protein
MPAPSTAPIKRAAAAAIVAVTLAGVAYATPYPVNLIVRVASAIWGAFR